MRKDMKRKGRGWEGFGERERINGRKRDGRSGKTGKRGEGTKKRGKEKFRKKGGRCKEEDSDVVKEDKEVRKEEKWKIGNAGNVGKVQNDCNIEKRI